MKSFLSANIGDLRRKSALSQSEVAASVCVSQQTISAWEIGIREPVAGHRRRLCELFNIDNEAELFLDHSKYRIVKNVFD